MATGPKKSGKHGQSRRSEDSVSSGYHALNRSNKAWDARIKNTLKQARRASRRPAA
jgi:hypothetical protein